MKGAAAGPASQQQVKKFTDAIIYLTKRHGVAGNTEARCRLHRHQHDQHLQGKEDQLGRRHDAHDGGACGQELGTEQELHGRIVGAIGDATHWECMKFLRPGITENQARDHLMKYLYSIPGMEDVEDVIVSSWVPTPGRTGAIFPIASLQPGDIVFMGFRRAHLEWRQVLLLPHLLRRERADHRAGGQMTLPLLEWLDAVNRRGGGAVPPDA